MQLANAQESFHKHALVLSADWGGDDFFNLNEKYNLYTITGPVSQAATGTAGSTNFNFSGEFGLLSFLGVGLQARIDNYIVNKEASGYQPTAAGGEIAALVNLHIIRVHRVDFMIGGVFGASKFTYSVDSSNNKVSGIGSYADLHATVRYYFGRFGLNASLYLPFSNFPSLSGDNINWGVGENVLSQWAAKGIGFNIGIQFRFLNPPGDK